MVLRSLVPALLIAGCAIGPGPVTSPTVRPTQWVRVGPLAVKVIKVVEDSRCPVDAQCVWPGRLVIRIALRGAGSQREAEIRLGEGLAIRAIPGATLGVTSVGPPRRTGTKPRYAFTFEYRDPR